MRALPRRPYVTFARLWYVITLLPVIGMVRVGSQIADRHTYVPSLDLSCLGAIGPALTPSGQGLWRRGAILGGIRLMLILVAPSYGKIDSGKDDIAAQECASAVTSPNYFSEYNLARAYAAQNRNDEALIHNRESIRFDPTQMARGGYDEAESALRFALRIDPQFALAASNMGACCWQAAALRRKFPLSCRATASTEIEPLSSNFNGGCNHLDTRRSGSAMFVSDSEKLRGNSS